MEENFNREKGVCQMYCFLFATIVCLLSFSVFAEKIAIVTNRKYDLEFNILKENKKWSVERFTGKQLSELAERFHEFDLVINGTLSGYQENADWKTVQLRLKDYLKKGGTLLLVDANYPWSLAKVIHPLGKDFHVWYHPCSSRGDVQRVTRRIWDPKLAVNFFPHDLQKKFADILTWQHLTCPKPWVSMAKCSDNMAVMLYRNIGKGTIYCISYADFGNGKSAAFKALVENIISDSNLKSVGVKLDSIKIGNQFGKNKLDVRFSALAGGKRQMQCTVIQGNKTLASSNRSWSIEERRVCNFSLSYVTSSYAEPIHILLSLSDGKKEIILKIEKKIVQPLIFFPWRNEVYPLIAEAFPVHLSIASDFMDASKYEICFRAGDRQIEGERIRENLWHCNLSSLEPGSHVLKTVIQHKESGKEFFIAEAPLKVWKRNPYYAVGSDNTFRVGNTKIFPLGFYHISWKLSDESRLSAVDFIKKAGANFLFAAKRPSDPAFPAFMRYAEKQGVHVIIEPTLPESNYPAVAGYAIGDEPDGKSIKAAILMAKQERLHARAFDLFSTLVLMTPSGFTNDYFRCADLIGHDPYPLPRAPISMVYYNIRQLVQKLDRTSRLPFAVPQAFGYRNHAFYKIPTPSEIRNMTYQTLVAGTRGILFYTYMDSGFDLNKYPALYDEMLKLVKEIRNLEEFFINGDFAEISTGEKEIFGASWNLKGEKLEILVNATREKGVVSGNGKEISLAPLEVKVIREKK